MFLDLRLGLMTTETIDDRLVIIQDYEELCDLEFGNIDITNLEIPANFGI